MLITLRAKSLVSFYQMLISIGHLSCLTMRCRQPLQDGCYSCSTAVEHTPQNLEVIGSNPAGCWALFFFFLFLPTFLRQWSVLKQNPQGGASLSVSCESNLKNGCQAVLPRAKQAQKVQIG